MHLNQFTIYNIVKILNYMYIAVSKAQATSSTLQWLNSSNSVDLSSYCFVWGQWDQLQTEIQ